MDVRLCRCLCNDIRPFVVFVLVRFRESISRGALDYLTFQVVDAVLRVPLREHEGYYFLSVRLNTVSFRQLQRVRDVDDFFYAVNGSNREHGDVYRSLVDPISCGGEVVRVLHYRIFSYRYFHDRDRLGAVFSRQGPRFKPRSRFYTLPEYRVDVSEWWRAAFFAAIGERLRVYVDGVFRGVYLYFQGYLVTPLRYQGAPNELFDGFRLLLFYQVLLSIRYGVGEVSTSIVYRGYGHFVVGSMFLLQRCVGVGHFSQFRRLFKVLFLVVFYPLYRLIVRFGVLGAEDVCPCSNFLFS